MKINQYELSNLYQQQFLLPVGAVILSIQPVYGSPVVWAMFDENENKLESKSIYIIKTGSSFSKEISEMKYLATYHVDSFGHSFHVFEDTKNEKKATEEYTSTKKAGEKEVTEASRQRKGLDQGLIG